MIIQKFSGPRYLENNYDDVGGLLKKEVDHRREHPGRPDDQIRHDEWSGRRTNGGSQGKWRENVT